MSNSSAVYVLTLTAVLSAVTYRTQYRLQASRPPSESVWYLCKPAYRMSLSVQFTARLVTGHIG